MFIILLLGLYFMPKSTVPFRYLSMRLMRLKPPFVGSLFSDANLEIAHDRSGLVPFAKYAS